jgi:hypothetical protein
MTPFRGVACSKSDPPWGTKQLKEEQRKIFFLPEVFTDSYAAS